jgi:hypothetical protein
LQISSRPLRSTSLFERALVGDLRLERRTNGEGITPRSNSSTLYESALEPVPGT